MTARTSTSNTSGSQATLGGATAIQVMAADPRFKVGVNLDGKLFGAEPDARLDRPFL